MKLNYNRTLNRLNSENCSLKKKDNIHKQTLNKLKNFSIGNLYPQNNNLNQVMNTSIFSNNTNKGNELNLSEGNKNDSTKYSYQLIDNLKNIMNQIDVHYNS